MVNLTEVNIGYDIPLLCSIFCDLSYSENIAEDFSLLAIQRKYDIHITERIKRLIATVVFISDKNTGAKLFVCHVDSAVFIVFRGTDDFADILTNMNVLLGGFHKDISKKSKVHGGFSNQYNSIKGNLLKVLSQICVIKNITKIICCGHSLGGALATIASVDLHIHLNGPKDKNPNRQMKKIMCITFGAPRVGNVHFRKHFNNYIGDSLRFVDLQDTIPYFPMSPFYSHVHDGKYFDENGNLQILRDVKWYYRIFRCCINSRILDIFSQHSTLNYINTIRTAFLKYDNNKNSLENFIVVNQTYV
jgi:hypothetical protein